MHPHFLTEGYFSLFAGALVAKNNNLRVGSNFKKNISKDGNFINFPYHFHFTFPTAQQWFHCIFFATDKISSLVSFAAIWIVFGVNIWMICVFCLSCLCSLLIFLFLFFIDLNYQYEEWKIHQQFLRCYNQMWTKETILLSISLHFCTITFYFQFFKNTIL